MSSALVLSFRRPSSNSQDWSQEELAEFYRVESALLQSGFGVTTDRGVSDEGDPWFVFCREDTEDVIAHFARIGREYIISSSFQPGVLCGRDFRTLVREILDSHPLMLPVRRRQGQKLYLHPAALLMALVASAYVISNENQLSGDSGSPDGHGKSASVVALLMQKFSIFAAAVFAVTWIEHHAQLLADLFDHNPLLHALFGDNATHASSAPPQLSDLEAALQTVHNVELGAHRDAPAHDAANAETAHDSEHQGAVALAQASTASVTAGKASDIGALNGPDAATAVQNVDSAATHTDLSAASNGTSQTLVPRVVQSSAVVQADAQGQTATAESVQPTAAAMSSDAFHVAATELGNLTSAAIVLSTGAVPLNQALQQAFQQAGFDSNLLHTLNAADGAITPPDLTSSTNAEVGPNTLGNLAAVTNSSTGATAPDALTPQTGTALGVDAQAMNFVEAFLHSNSSVEVILSGENVVITDTHTSDARSTHFGVMTFDMSDGSTLSVVGIIPPHSQAMSAALTA